MSATARIHGGPGPGPGLGPGDRQARSLRRRVGRPAAAVAAASEGTVTVSRVAPPGLPAAPAAATT